MVLETRLKPRTTRYGLETLNLEIYGLETLILGQQDMV